MAFDWDNIFDFSSPSSDSGQGFFDPSAINLSGDQSGFGLNPSNLYTPQSEPVQPSNWMGFDSSNLYTPDFSFYDQPLEPFAAQDPSALDRTLSGVKSTGAKLWDKATDNPLMTAMLLMAGANAIRGPQTPAAVKPLTEGTQKTIDYVKQRGEPLDKLTQQLTTQYQTGKIDPADEMRINQWYQGEKAKIDQYYVKTGMPDSTAHLYALQELETKRKGLYDEVRQGYLNSAMKGMGMQGQTTGQVANLQNYLNQAIAELQQSGDLQSAQALQNMMMAAGYSAGRAG